MFTYVSEQLGVSPDQIKVVFLLVISVPLSLVFPHLPSSDTSIVPHLVAALPSIVFFTVILDNLRWGLVQLVMDSVATWLIVKWGVKTKQGRMMPWIVFVVAMGHLTLNNINTFVHKVDRDNIEITGSQMVLCMKLISFAWSVYDGQQPDAELDATQRSTKISKVPGIIPFLGYTLFFPSVLAGPSFSYSAYQAWTSHALFKKESEADKQKTWPRTSRSLIPDGRRRKAVKRLVTGLAYLAVYSVYSWTFAYDRMLEPTFLAKVWYQRIGFMQIAGFIARTKYYAVWCIAESAYILSGLGFNPRTGHYDASRNVRIRTIELAPNFKILLDSWNINTNIWLRECIYKRVTKKGKKPGFQSTQITFMTSALWHGVNPCYLMTFVLGGFYQSIGRLLRALVRPFFLPPGSVPPPKSFKTPTPAQNDPKTMKPAQSSAPPAKTPPPPQTPLKWAYDVAGIIVTQLALNFAVAPFMLLSVRASWQAWRVVYFYGLAMAALPLLVFNLGLARHLKRTLRRRDEKAAARAATEDEKKQLQWEQRYEGERERKRLARMESGIPSIAPDVERMMEEEKRQAESPEGKKEL
ncbi:Lysophospholipid acyltransferase [Microbotryomycetes sp. JL201]|nr:Lysophospholipid acyltransferase [Microbotryomycetes sp. JL201]